MTGRTHDAFAFTSLVTIAVLYPPINLNITTLIASIMAADIGALLPDIDQAGNRLWDMLPSGNNVGRVFRKIFYKHRTLTHSLLGVLFFYNFSEWLLIKVLNPEFINPNLIFASLMIGYLSHLLSDSFTEGGLPLLFPLEINFGIPPIKRLRIKTGKWFENLVFFPAIWVYLIWFINKNSDTLVKILNLNH